MSRDVYQAAREAFDRYASLGPGDFPADPMSALQVRLARWQSSQFGTAAPTALALGINEEFFEAFGAFAQIAAGAGKIAHATLKSSQRIRGFEDEERLRAAVGDGIADILIFSCQLCTVLRLDIGTLFRGTADLVLKRDWRGNPHDGTV